MQTGKVTDLIGRRPDQHGGILLGEDLAANLAVSVGDTVFFISMRVTPTPGGGVIPRQRAFEVVGLFKFGLLPMDTATAVMAIDEASEMLGKEGPDLLELRVSSLEQAVPIRRELQTRLGSGYVVQDWTQLNEPLYAALWLEKVAIALTIGLIIMVAALNIVASLVLLVMEKSRDIAILRTMGASSRTIRRIFVYQGLTIGLVGTTAGTVLGLIVCWIADRYRLIQLPSEVYQIAHLPFRIEPLDVLAVFASAVLVCLVATIYPSRQAGRLDPAEALRNQ
jgi:lipoprotein-releasing system permease protein